MTAGTLLVLGAGEDQAGAYREARRRGLGTVGVDLRADAPAVHLADRFLHLTTRDADAIHAAICGESLAGVIAPAGDAATPTARELALRLGLPVPVSATAAECSVNKTVFRAVVEDLGLPNYRSVTACDEQELLAAARSLDGYVVVKPTDSSGSKGVAVVSGEDEVRAAIQDARAVSVSGQIMVEQYVHGRPLAVEAFLSCGRPTLCLIAERSTTGPPHMITTTHWAPARLTPDIRSGIETLVARVADRIEHPDGPLNLDLVLDPDGVVWAIEMGARLGGNGMPQLVRLVHGVDTVAAAVDHAIGRPFDVTPIKHHAAAIYVLHTEHGGRVQSLHHLENFADQSQVVDFELFVSPGDIVCPYSRAANKLGYVLLCDEDEVRLHRTVEDIRRRFGVSLVGEGAVRGCDCPVAAESPAGSPARPRTESVLAAPAAY